MKKFICLAFIVFVALLSCSKKPGKDPAPTPPPADTTVVVLPVTNPPLPTDSLFLWKKVSPQEGIDIYFTTRSRGFYISGDDSIRQSLDSGHTWAAYAKGVSDALNFIFVDQQNGFVLGNRQIASTTDGGDNWSVKNIPSSAASATSATFVSSSTGYMIDMDGQVFKTSDGCVTWIKINSIKEPNSSIFCLTENNGFIFLGAGDFYKTTDGFVTLQKLATHIAPSRGFTTLFFQDMQKGYYACDSGLLKTVDGGITWTRVRPPTGNVSIVRFPDANTGYFVSSNTIYKTTDAGNTWTTSLKLLNNQFPDMNFIDSTTGWAISNEGIYHLSK